MYCEKHFIIIITKSTHLSISLTGPLCSNQIAEETNKFVYIYPEFLFILELFYDMFRFRRSDIPALFMGQLFSRNH